MCQAHAGWLAGPPGTWGCPTIMYNRLVQHAITNQYKAPRQGRLHLNHIYIDICRCGWLKAGSCSFSYFCLRAEGAAAPDGWWNTWLQMADETRSEFTARFDTDGFPQDYPKGFRLHQRTRSSKASIAGSNHEAFRIVLLWLRQKYVVFTRGVTRMPSHVRRMLEPRHGPKLLPCPASGWRSKARQSESSESQCFFIAILLVINIMTLLLTTTTYY